MERDIKRLEAQIAKLEEVCFETNNRIKDLTNNLFRGEGDKSAEMRERLDKYKEMCKGRKI